VKESTIGLMRNKPLIEQVGTRIKGNTAKDIYIKTRIKRKHVVFGFRYFVLAEKRGGARECS
jgi:hypothetical protein